MREKAYFIFRPRTISDLSLENPKGNWKEYRIVKTIQLSQIDFENLATDMLADRKYIEDSAALCIQPNDCLLVTNRNKRSELLVIPCNGRFIRYAALRPVIRLL